MTHGRTVCSCGIVISTCRCIDHGLQVKYIPNGCARCKNSAQTTQSDPIRIAVRRPHHYEVAQYGPETKTVVDEWFRKADNFGEHPRPDYGEWAVKITYPWSDGYEVASYTDEAFRYWFELLPQ